MESSQHSDNIAATRTVRGLCFKKLSSESTFSVSGDSEQPLGLGAVRNAVSKQDGEVTSGTVDFFGTYDSDELM